MNETSRGATSRVTSGNPLKFLISWEWLGYFVLVVVFAIVAWGLSQWQFARRDEALAQIHLINTNYNAPPAALTELTDGVTPLPTALTYRPVTLTGSYEHSHTLAVRNRPYQGQAGFEIIVPFRATDGHRFVVDRGWVPVGNNANNPSTIPAAPAGTVTIVARLKPFEPGLGRTAPPSQLPTIQWSQIAKRVGAASLSRSAYGLLASENPAPQAAPAKIPRPDIDEGPHLSYALQWIGFAVLAFIGFFWAVRRSRQRVIEAGGDTEVLKRPNPTYAHRLKRDADAEYEDAVLDESLR